MARMRRSAAEALSAINRNGQPGSERKRKRTMINPFIISSVEFQRTLRRYTDREQWVMEVTRLGVAGDQARAYDADAYRYACTTPYQNSTVVAYARRVAKEALLRGEAMPASAEKAIEAEEKRELARLIGRQPAPRQW